MFLRSVVFVAFLYLSAAFAIGHSSGDGSYIRGSAHYQGPPAPLNKDGTVALTPEVQQAKAAHDAAVAAEFKRFEEAKRLAAAHPDLTSPPDHAWKDYTSQTHSQGKGYNAGKYSAFSEIHNQGPSYHKGQYSTSGHLHNMKTYMPAPLNKDGTVSLTPEVQQAKSEHDAAIAAELMRLEEAKRVAAAHPDLTSPDHGWDVHQDYTSQHYTQGKGYNAVGYFITSGKPAHDKDQYSTSGHVHNMKTYMPAPLNKDGTVALTPEVQQAKAAHDAAVAAELIRLDVAKKLAAAYPDLTSPHDHKDYTSQMYDQGKGYDAGRHSAASGYYVQGPSKGQHSTSGHNHNLKTYMAAPLNKDGTVALTPEVQMAKAAHEAALGAELMKLTQAQNLAMAHPDMTSPQEHPEVHFMQGSHSDQRTSQPSSEAQMPAPLNPDGTVAQTAAYKAIASSHSAEYNKTLLNVNQHKMDPHSQNQAAKGYSY